MFISIHKTNESGWVGELLGKQLIVHKTGDDPFSPSSLIDQLSEEPGFTAGHFDASSSAMRLIDEAGNLMIRARFHTGLDDGVFRIIGRKLYWECVANEVKASEFRDVDCVMKTVFVFGGKEIT